MRTLVMLTRCLLLVMDVHLRYLRKVDLHSAVVVAQTAHALTSLLLTR